MKLSIVIPAFNEEKTIVSVLKKLDALKLLDIRKEVIVVDDGSSDATADKVKRFAREMRGLQLIQHIRNSGKGTAVRTGIGAASGDYILIQDADMEYDPAYIPDLLAALGNKKKTVVYGTRLRRLPHLHHEEKNKLFLVHYLGNRFLSLVASILYGQWLTDMETGYKLFPKQAVEKMTLHGRSFDFEPEITAKLLKRGYKIIEIPIEGNPRGYNEGKKLNAMKDGPIALWTLFKYRFVD